jgi:PAS domain S-box-containing protein
LKGNHNLNQGSGEKNLSGQKKSKRLISPASFLESFFHHIPHGCLIINHLGEVKAANRMAGLWLGKEVSAMAGQSLSSFLELPSPFDLNSLWEKKDALNWDMTIGSSIFHCSLLPLPEVSAGKEKLAALFIADVTKEKLREKRIAGQLEQQKFLLHLASTLLVCPAERIEEIIALSLKNLAEYAQADRASLLLERGAGQLASMIAEWQAEGRPSLRPIWQNFNPAVFRYWSKIILEKKEVVQLSSTSSLPSEAAAEKNFLEKTGIKSLLMVPILQEKRAIGALGISSHQERDWPEETINLLLLAADIFANAFKRRHRARTMAALVRIGEAAATADNLESLLELIHQSISQLLPARNFYLALYDPKKRLVSFPYFVDEKDPKPQPRALGRGITEYVLRTGKPLLATDKEIQELASKGEIEVIGTIPFVWLGVPLKIKGQTIGVLAVQSYDRNVTYIPEDEVLLRLISDDVALVINRKRNEAELAEKEQFLSSIFRSIQDGLCVLDKNFNILEANPAAEKWFDLTLPLEGQKCYQAFYGRPEPCEPCPTRRALETGLPSMEVIPFFRADNRETRWLEIFAFPLVDRKSGLTSGAIEYIRDITDRKITENQLKESLREKDILLRELHHRVKNNMQVISSLLNLQANHTSDPVAREMFRETQRRIRSMALVHEQLYQSANLSRINFASYLDHLSSHLFQSCGVSTHRVKLKKQTEEIFLEVNTAIPLGMIFNEILTNSLKHAFPGEREGEIRITLTRVEANRCLLEVADNGVGLPEDFSLEESQTLGLQIVHTLSQQIQAEIKIDRSQGTSFQIFFSCPLEPGSP